MMRHVWRNYEKRAFAKDELRQEVFAAKDCEGLGEDSHSGDSLGLIASVLHVEAGVWHWPRQLGGHWPDAG